ncbi:flavoprotein [Nocardia cyriacigeorgica]|uniref:flavoprotein n=1 Tax=Nocardia cyriacigeorgica TaxID=135487 RepID=UPI001893E3FA|nr:flavoprotein [Nocardia cyriacigeorgica]MBF6345547.1 flavoprotein [Nocardia cyriacigeorgica]
MTERTRVLYAIVTGASPADTIGELVELAQADGWDVCVIASPNGARFIDSAALAAQTGHPVRSEFKDPGTDDLLPPPDAIIAAPLTTNSMAKWATGIGDTLPLALLVEAVGAGLPVVAIPHAKQEQMNFPAIRDARDRLAEWGVRFVRVADDADAGPLPWMAALKALG